jgi:hypothetical protein
VSVFGQVDWAGPIRDLCLAAQRLQGGVDVAGGPYLLISDAASVITVFPFLVMLPGAWASVSKWLRERRRFYRSRHAPSPSRAGRSQRGSPSSCSTVRPAHRPRARHAAVSTVTIAGATPHALAWSPVTTAARLAPVTGRGTALPDAAASSARGQHHVYVGLAGLEPATSCTQSTRASQAALQPVSPEDNRHVSGSFCGKEVTGGHKPHACYASKSRCSSCVKPV